MVNFEQLDATYRNEKIKSEHKDALKLIMAELKRSEAIVWRYRVAVKSLMEKFDKVEPNTLGASFDNPGTSLEESVAALERSEAKLEEELEKIKRLVD